MAFMICFALNNFTHYFSSQCFKDSKKEALIKAFNKISADTGIASTSDEFDNVLDQISEMDSLYQTYLKRNR